MEYAEVFKTVCVDAAYYSFPGVQYLEGLAAQVPADFQFGFKVTDEITLRRFPNLPRFGQRAGQLNEHYLKADVFERGFLRPCEAIRPQVGLIIFEFSRLPCGLRTWPGFRFGAGHLPFPAPRRLALRGRNAQSALASAGVL